MMGLLVGQNLLSNSFLFMGIRRYSKGIIFMQNKKRVLKSLCFCNIPVSDRGASLVAILKGKTAVDWP